MIKTILLLFLTFFSGVSVANPELPQGSGPWVVLLSYRDKAELEQLKDKHDFWRVDDKNKTVLMQISSVDEYQTLQKDGFSLQLHQEIMQQQQALKDLLWEKGWSDLRHISGFSCYRTVTEAFQSMTDMRNNYPNLVELVDIGDSWYKINSSSHTGHDMQVVKITNKNNAISNKPILFAMGSIHAREYPPMEVVSRFAEYLLAQYGTNPDVTWLLDYHEIHLLPVGNPDGRTLAETESSPSQRKNMNENHCYNGDQQGVDMNRNFGFKWNQGSGSSGVPCSQTFRGSAALSEPETQAIDNYIATLFPDERPDDITTPAPSNKPGVYMDIHNVAKLTLFPWGFDSQSVTGLAPNHTQLQTLARRLSFYTGYKPQPSNHLYGADGASDDNAYGKLGVAAFTIELGEGGFYSSCSSFENTIWPTNLPSLIYAAKASRTPYITPAGPNVNNLPTAAIDVAQGSSASIQGEASDLDFNQNNGTETTHNITAVKAYLGTPPWQSGATPIAMSATDGAFDSSKENFNGSIPTTGLSAGKHLLWLVATDAGGVSGVPSAVYLNVIDPQLIGTLNGTVTDANSNLAIASARVVFDDIQTTTDSNGFYEIQTTARVADLQVSKSGYETANVAQVSVVAQQSNTQNVSLQPKCGDISNNLESFSTIADAETAGWTHAATTGTDDWSIATGDDHTSGSGKAFVAADPNTTTDKYLASPEVKLTNNAELRFWHKHAFEGSNSYYDGGVLEISTDQGTTWNDLGSAITQNGYNGTLSGGHGQPLGARQAFVGTLGTFTEVVVDLSAYSQQTVMFRWRLGADSSQAGGNWLIDDITVSGYQQCNITDLIFKNGFESGTTQ